MTAQHLLPRACANLREGILDEFVPKAVFTFFVILSPKGSDFSRLPSKLVSSNFPANPKFQSDFGHLLVFLPFRRVCLLLTR